MIYGSLFSGARLLDHGVEMAARDAGVPLSCAFQVELDPFCRAVLAKHHPEVPRYEDVTRVGSTGHALPAVDLLVGGFPCQDTSLAGRGAGIHGGERSWLWFEYLRIIHETRPRGVLVENVPGLLRRGLDAVVAGLADAGYAVEATRLRASDLGAPHRRERLFLVAYADGEGQLQPRRTQPGERGRPSNGGDAAGVADAARTRGQGPRPTRQRQRDALVAREGGVADASGVELRQQPGRRSGARGTGAAIAASYLQPAQPGVGRMPDGRRSWLDEARWPAPPGPQADWEPPRTAASVPNRAARLKALGNGCTPQQAYVAARHLFARLEVA